MRSWVEFPFIVIATFASGIAMLAPALLAYQDRNLAEARVFMYCGLIFVILSIFLAIATAKNRAKYSATDQLFSLTSIFFLLPAFLATPVYITYENLTALDAYFEFVSCLTTTGASLLDISGEISDSIHFWRAQVAWMGGLLMWAAALTILRPLGLGGFETVLQISTRALDGLYSHGSSQGHFSLGRSILSTAPLYIIISGSLWGLLLFTGETPYSAAMIAMSTVSTSGITGNAAAFTNGSPLFLEIVIFAFMFLAVSKIWVVGGRSRLRLRSYSGDIEIRLALLLIFCALIGMLIFDWQKLVQEYNTEGLLQLVYNCWGIIFTSLSFLTTTGFESSYWSGTDGFGFPEQVLVLLALVGGGVATTAGGIKLLRMFLLYQRCRNEVERMIYPSAVTTLRGARWGIRNEGAGIAWIFIMVFLLSLAALLLYLAASGQDIEVSFVIAASILSTTGPLAEAVLDSGFSYHEFTSITKVVLAIAMIAGRLEMIVFIFLLGLIVSRR